MIGVVCNSQILHESIAAGVLTPLPSSSDVSASVQYEEGMGDRQSVRNNEGIKCCIICIWSFLHKKTDNHPVIFFLINVDLVNSSFSKEMWPNLLAVLHSVAKNNTDCKALYFWFVVLQMTMDTFASE
jgi:hypothetical protein